MTTEAQTSSPPTGSEPAPTHQSRPSRWQRIKNWCANHPKTCVAIGVVTGIVVLAGVVTAIALTSGLAAIPALTMGAIHSTAISHTITFAAGALASGAAGGTGGLGASKLAQVQQVRGGTQVGGHHNRQTTQAAATHAANANHGAAAAPEAAAAADNGVAANRGAAAASEAAAASGRGIAAASGGASAGQGGSALVMNFSGPVHIINHAPAPPAGVTLGTGTSTSATVSPPLPENPEATSLPAAKNETLGPPSTEGTLAAASPTSGAADPKTPCPAARPLRHTTLVERKDEPSTTVGSPTKRRLRAASCGGSVSPLAKTRLEHFLGERTPAPSTGIPSREAEPGTRDTSYTATPGALTGTAGSPRRRPPGGGHFGLDDVRKSLFSSPLAREQKEDTVDLRTYCRNILANRTPLGWNLLGKARGQTHQAKYKSVCQRLYQSGITHDLLTSGELGDSSAAKIKKTKDNLISLSTFLDAEINYCSLFPGLKSVIHRYGQCSPKTARCAEALRAKIGKGLNLLPGSGHEEAFSEATLAISETVTPPASALVFRGAAGGGGGVGSDALPSPVLSSPLSRTIRSVSDLGSPSSIRELSPW